MKESSTAAEWRNKLEQTFPDSRIDVADESHRHAGHLPAGSPSRGTHASIRVVSASFEGVSLPQRHRMVYQAIGLDRQDSILHAVQVRALTPDEAGRAGQSGSSSGSAR